MEPLTLKLRHAVEEDIECWDDDDDLQGIDELQLRSASTATSVTSSSAVPPNHRDSVSSRLSTRSDLDSNGGDNDWEVLLQDDNSTKDAIASAKTAGIPIPDNVPKSALMGGTIKRLGGRKIRKAMGDDWSEDLQLPTLEAGLELKLNDDRDFPESLRQISAAFRKSPIKAQEVGRSREPAISTKAKIITPSLDKFRDDYDDDFFGDVPTIKVAKARSPQKPFTFTTPPVKPPKSSKETESFEEDLEFPLDGALKLSARKEIPRTPASSQDDFDTEWAEGSLGTRFGGTKRDARSNRSSSASAFSPSVSSCLTAESEDEGLDGLVLPDGPLKFDEALKRRQQNQSPDPANYSGERQAAKRAAAKDDFFSGIEIGDGDVFDSRKLTLNRNIKHKTGPRPTSPARRTQTTLTFTSKPSTSTTRIPRMSGHSHHLATLEPVSESGAPVPRYRRPESRLGGHSAQSSVSSIPNPTAPSTPSTPSRRGLTSKPSREGLRNEPTTTGAQLLKSKRSMPVMRNLPSPARPPPYPRPPSRSETSSRPSIPSRPKTPVDRSESSLSMARRPPVPFLPAGASQQQSHHISIKSSRHFRRHDSEGSNEGPIPLRSISRLSSLRPETPGKSNRDLPSELLAAAAKRTMTKPTRRRNFGDGTELEIFDDLPTSATLENRFVKQPVGRGAPKSLRSKLIQAQYPPPSRTETPMPPSTPLSPTRLDYVPRFARDTAASRIAREQRVTSTAINPRDREGGPLAPLSSNWKGHLAASRGIPSPAGSIKNKKGRVPGAVYTKPHLIKPLGNGVNEAKSVKGMYYNPSLYRWEGNENALAPFDVPSTPISPKPAPALITNVGAMQGVQVVGGMVFDPQRMCWLKMASTQPSKGGVAVAPDEEEDVFAGLDDLEDRSQPKATEPKARNVSSDVEGVTGEKGDSSDEWLVGEEFDVGPEFVRRQRAEEDKWRRKVEKWVVRDREELGDGWRWAIRDVV